MSRFVFALLFGLAVIGRGTSEEPKWERGRSDKNDQVDEKEKPEAEPEARFGGLEGFRPHFPGPYGPNSPPIRPAYDDHNAGFHDPYYQYYRPGRPHYHGHGSCRCTYGFNCPDLIIGSCGKGRRFCCYGGGGGFPAWGSQTYYPVKRPNYYGPVNHLLASNNYARPGYNGAYPFPDYHRPHVSFGRDSSPDEPFVNDEALEFGRAANVAAESSEKTKDQPQNDAATS